MQVGQQVVCIDGDFPPEILLLGYQQLPEEGKTYTIRAVYIGRGKAFCKPGATDGEVGLLLKEVQNPPDLKHLGKNELGFNSERFKPLNELVTAGESSNEQVDLVGKDLVLV